MFVINVADFELRL